MKTAITLDRTSAKILLFLSVFTLALLSGCTLSGIDKDSNQEITEADLQAASQILGESLSDENDGVMSSLNDALTTVSESGFIRAKQATTLNGEVDDDDKSGRGTETNFSYSYDPATGIHTIAFKRKVYDGSFSKEVTDTLKYIFTDNNNQFIAYPREQEDRIETIDFKGFRQGDIQSLEKNSFFTRNDTFLIDGLSEASAVLNIDGVHHGNGDLQKTTDDGGTFEKTYSIVINFLNINIDKEVVRTNQSLEQGVTGTLSWSMEFNRTSGGSSTTKTVEGTIEMNGDGTALLRFERFNKLFQINLDDGHVRDHDNEFEGLVKSVNLDRSSFTLKSGRTVRITDATDFGGETDLTSLTQVAEHLEAGHEVKAEGEGRVDGDVFVASVVEFEVRESDLADNTVHFEAYISSVNLETGTILLRDERVIQVPDTVEIDESGDYFSLAGVQEALELGKTVIVDGKGIESDNAEITYIADILRFDQGVQDTFEYEDHVISVNIQDSIFSLEDGRVVWINDQTEIKSGDYTSLEGVQQALEQQQHVVAFGEAVETDKEGVDIIAVSVKFVNAN